MDIDFRRLTTQEDAQKYREIRLECLKNYPQSFASSYENQSKLAELVFEKYILENNPANFVVGAFDGDQLIGISAFAQEPKAKRAHEGSIIQVYIKATYQGRHIGKDLLNFVIQAAFEIPTIEQLIISAVTENKGALHLYQHLGFEPYGTHKHYMKTSDGQYYDVTFMYLDKSTFLKNEKNG
ncbi:MAG TPA: GNAT family N-acetyltransferase [Microscillaceae bacterium]|nr:GNAT family N-acetyltransferase [Microscillaceae bacterium]